MPPGDLTQPTTGGAGSGGSDPKEEYINARIKAGWTRADGEREWQEIMETKAAGGIDPNRNINKKNPLGKIVGGIKGFLGDMFGGDEENRMEDARSAYAQEEAALGRGEYELPGANLDRSRIENYLDEVNRRKVGEDFRGRQLETADRLGRIARGEESLSQAQLAQAAGRNIEQQRALLANTQRGGNRAAAARQAAQQTGIIGRELAAQQGIAGIQERMSADRALAGLLGQGRSGDVGTAQLNDAARQGLLDRNRMINELAQRGSMERQAEIGRRGATIVGSEQPGERSTTDKIVDAGARTWGAVKTWGASELARNKDKKTKRYSGGPSKSGGTVTRL